MLTDSTSLCVGSSIDELVEPVSPRPDEPGQRASSSLGLSSTHISPQPFYGPGSFSSLPPGRLSYAMNGSVVRLTGPRLTSQSNTCGVRGKVKLFSRGSQKRLRILLASVDRQRSRYLPLLLTLTYPAEWPSSPREWKRHLDNFSKRLSRHYPAAAVVWVIEFQRRGAPHFHLIVFGVHRIDHKWLSRAWYEVVGSGDERHLRAGTRVERARKWNAVQAYISKYVSKNRSKDLPVPDGIGRWWGVLNRERLNSLVEWVEVAVPAYRFFAIRRVLRRFLRSQGVSLMSRSTVSGVTAFMSASSARRLLLL